VAERELAAAVDNPVVLPDGRVESNGNFHGAPVAYVLDFLAIVSADLASIASAAPTGCSTRRARTGCRRSSPTTPESTRPDDRAVHAGRARVENKRLAVPASVDSIPSSAMQEDHVSMGWSAARKLRTSVDNLRRILAVELLASARGIDLRAPIEPGPATGAVVRALRETVPGPGVDRFLAPEGQLLAARVG
jgi:histidine ammonia-lyase